jgi:DNA-binding MltR family transcriptional regulator
MKKGEVLSIVAQKRIIERLDRIEQNFDRIFDNLDNLAENVDDLIGGILRHDQTLYDFVVKPVRDEEDKNGR